MNREGKEEEEETFLYNTDTGCSNIELRPCHDQISLKWFGEIKNTQDHLTVFPLCSLKRSVR